MNNLDSRSNMTSLSSENPVFKFDDASSSDELQAKRNNSTKYDKPQERWVIGLSVSGIEINTDKEYTGKIISIHNNKEGELEYVVIQDENEKEISLDPNSLKQLYKKEKKIKGFNEWINESYSYKSNREKISNIIEDELYKNRFFKKLLKDEDAEFDYDTYPTETIIITFSKLIYSLETIKEEFLKMFNKLSFSKYWDIEIEIDSNNNDDIYVKISEPNFKR